jgi:hypothetical protein
MLLAATWDFWVRVRVRVRVRVIGLLSGCGCCILHIPPTLFHEINGIT